MGKKSMWRLTLSPFLNATELTTWWSSDRSCYHLRKTLDNNVGNDVGWGQNNILGDNQHLNFNSIWKFTLKPSAASYRAWSPPLMSSGSVEQTYSQFLSNSLTNVEVCMTLACSFHLLFPEFTALFSSYFFWDLFCFSLSLFKLISSVISKAVIL